MLDFDLYPDLRPPPALDLSGPVNRFTEWFASLHDWLGLQADVVTDLSRQAWPDGDCPIQLRTEDRSVASDAQRERFCLLLRVDRFETVMRLFAWLERAWCRLIQFQHLTDTPWTNRHLLGSRYLLIMRAVQFRALLIEPGDEAFQTLRHLLARDFPLEYPDELVS